MNDQHIDSLEVAAIELWHRFASESVEEWEEEIHKAEYRFAAKAVIDVALSDLISALEIARNFIAETPHGDDCFVSDHYDGDPGNRCNCGKEQVAAILDETMMLHQTDEVIE